MTQEFILVQDDSCHWYVIPAEKERHWHLWFEKHDNIEDGLLPEYAEAVGGSPSLVQFTGYRIR